MFLKAILSLVRPGPLALQTASALAGSVLCNPEVELFVFDKSGSPEFRKALEQVLRIAPPERVHLEGRSLDESYTASIQAVPVGPGDRVVLVHDDDAWMGLLGGAPGAGTGFAAVLPTIVVYGHSPLIAWAPEGGAYAASDDLNVRLKSMRFDMRQYTPYPFLFGAMSFEAWSAFTGFLSASPMHLPTWDRVMALATLASGPSRLSTDWTYFYDYGKWNAGTAHDEYIKWLNRLGLESYSAMGALLLRTLHGLDQMALLSSMAPSLTTEESAAILQWIAFDTIGYFRRKLASGEALTPSLQAQWAAVETARHQAPSPLFEVMMGQEFPLTVHALKGMLVDPMESFGLPGLEPQLAFWGRALEQLSKHFRAQEINPELFWKES